MVWLIAIGMMQLLVLAYIAYRVDMLPTVTHLARLADLSNERANERTLRLMDQISG